MIQAVVFDMDGLMFDTEHMSLALWNRAAEEFGYPDIASCFTEAMGVNNQKAKEIFQKRLGADFPFDAFMERTRILADEYVAANGVPLRPGLFELLEYLKCKNIPAAVATSTSRKRTLRYLEMSGAARFFSGVVCGDMVERSKPDPDIYLKAARELQKDPRDCVALEDSINGCLSAIAAGMKTVMVPDMLQPGEELRHKLYACVSSLTEVIPVLEKLKASETEGWP